jgi:hypothetical protein
MNLAIWIPITFGLGIAVLLLCFAFLEACEKI